MPALRERRTDIPLLAHHFLDHFVKRSGNTATLSGFSEEALDSMQRFPWPGNVRELQSTIERATVLSRGPMIGREDLRLPTVEELPPLKAGTTIKEVERSLTVQTLEECGGNVSQAARILGVSRNWIHYKLKEWNESTT
jgi:Nif-specific regulatory protein